MTHELPLNLGKLGKSYSVNNLATSLTGSFSGPITPTGRVVVSFMLQQDRVVDFYLLGYPYRGKIIGPQMPRSDKVTMLRTINDRVKIV